MLQIQRFSFWRSSHSQVGFTLIEMLISVSIMMIVVGGGLVAYIRFNDRQTLIQAGKEVGTYLRVGQTRAQQGVTPAGCDYLESYSVRGNAGFRTVGLYAVCANGAILVQNYGLVGTVSFVSTFNIKFGARLGGVTNPGTVQLTNGTYQYTVTVTKGGEVTAGEISGGGN